MNYTAFYLLKNGAIDLFGNYDGTATSQVTFNDAAGFLTAGAKIDLPQITYSKVRSFTITAQVNLTSYDTLNPIYSDEDSGVIFGELYVRQSKKHKGELMYTIYYGNASNPSSISCYSSGITLSLGVWHTVQVVYENGSHTLTFFVDGTSYGVTNLAAGLAPGTEFLTPVFGPIGGGDLSYKPSIGGTLNGQVKNVSYQAIAM